MTLPDVVDTETWLKARKELLAQEKELTRSKDALNTKRRELPMVRIEKAYELVGADGPRTLGDLFEGRRQLIVQHFMFDPSWDDGCPSCTAAADEMSDGLIKHLEARETSFALVSRAPYPKLADYGKRRGWTLPWYSCFDSDFNYDFHVSLDAEVAPVRFNYRDAAELEAAGMGWVNEKPGEQPGMSCFLRDGEDVFHTYSTFARGTEQVGGGYGFLDMTALGRQEEWEQPSGRAVEPHAADPNFS